MNIGDKIIIQKDFSDSPGSRYKKDGDNSGEEFLESLLLPKFEKAVKNDYVLLVDIDGLWGYPSSFISGSFGKLSEDKGAELVLKHLEIKSDDSETRRLEILEEIKSPQSHVV